MTSKTKKKLGTIHIIQWHNRDWTFATVIDGVEFESQSYKTERGVINAARRFAARFIDRVDVKELRR